MIEGCFVAFREGYQILLLGWTIWILLTLLLTHLLLDCCIASREGWTLLLFGGQPGAADLGLHRL